MASSIEVAWEEKYAWVLPDDAIAGGFFRFFCEIFVSLSAKVSMSMSPHDIKAAVEQLAVLSDGWVRAQTIPPIERDLALEKLRRIYEDLLSVPAAGTEVPPMAASETLEPLSINLDEVLTVELEQPNPVQEMAESSNGTAEESVSAGPEGMPTNVDVEAATEDPEVEVELIFADEEESDEEVADETELEPNVDKPESVSAEAPMPIAESTVATLGESEPAVEMEDAASLGKERGAVAHHSATEVPEFVRPTVSIADHKEEELLPHNTEEVSSGKEDSEQTVVCPPTSLDMLPAEGNAEAKPEKAEPTLIEAVAPKQSAEQVTDEDILSEEEDAPRTMVQSLFGPEDPEELRRHKTKQRILMSLYDLPENAPTVSASQSSRSVADSSTSHAETSHVADSKPKIEEVLANVGKVCVEVEPSEFEETEAEESIIEMVTVDEPEPERAESVEPSEISEKVSASVTTTTASEETDAEPHRNVSEEPPVADLSPRRAAITSESVGQTGYTEERVTSGGVLGEIINHDVRTLADELSASHHDVASELARMESVDDLRKAIGINDKFLLIRDLFGGDAEAYEQAMDILNAFDNLDDCLIHIAEQYVWNPNSDGAKLLIELLERKFA